MLSSDRDKYHDGVQKMSEMSERLRRLQDEVAAMQPRLRESQVEVTQIMSRLQQVVKGLGHSKGMEHLEHGLYPSQVG